MGCPGIEFGHLRLQVSFTSAPNGRKPAVESTGFKAEIPDAMCARTVPVAQQTHFRTLATVLTFLKVNWIRDRIVNIV